MNDTTVQTRDFIDNTNIRVIRGPEVYDMKVFLTKKIILSYRFIHCYTYQGNLGEPIVPFKVFFLIQKC